jgi:hypothetical protein
MEVALFDSLSACATGESRLSLLSNAQEPQLYHSIGRNCEMLDGVCNNLRDIILELRSRGVTLNDPGRLLEAMGQIRAGYRKPPDDDTVKKYARTLNQFLLMPPSLIPENPILTGSLPQWFQKGDEVACYHSGHWWHAVVVGDVNKGAKKIQVFWVGWAECDTGSERSATGSGPSILYKNPTKCDRGDVRSYRDCNGVKSGSLAQYDVEYIQRKYCVSQDETLVQPSACESTSSALAAKPSIVPRRSAGRSEISRILDTTLSHLATGSTKSAMPSTPQSTSLAANVSSSSRPDGSAAANESDDADDEETTSECEARGSKTGRKLRRRPSKAHVEIPPSATQARKRRKLKEPRMSAAPTSRVEDFFWATLPSVTNSCIDTLELLAAGKNVHPDVEKDGLAMLASRCQALHKLYGNMEFLEFLAVALESLASYEGKQDAYARKFMVDNLRRFGFVISPRMWSKLELLMLMIIILEPDLYYMCIRQKDRKDERDQNR